MKHLGILLISSIAVAACASHNTPPAASSATVADATNEPNKGPDFAPAASDGLATAPADARRANNATQPAPVVNSGTDQTVNGNDSKRSGETNATWGNGADGSSGMDPTTGNAAAAPTERSSQPAEADNSRVNQRDRNGSTLTPMDQGPSAADRKITRDIRQAVMNDSSLSFIAKNVKIITINGKVTLRGPVKTEAERTAIEAAARKVVGGGALVDSQLELSK